MPDVGVLNLQIRDNSMQAAQGLSRLANVLKSIKASTTGLRLTSVATGINKIRESVAKINNSDLQKLKILTAEIQKLQAVAGSVNGIRISFGSTKAGGGASSGAMEQAQAIRDMARDASTAMEYVGQRIQQDNEQAERFASTMEGVRSIIQNTGWTAQATAEQFQQMFMAWNAMRQAASIGAGGGYGLPPAGPIYAEGSVTDAVEPLRLTAGAIEEVRDATREAVAAKAEFANPEGWGIGTIEELVTHSGVLGDRLRGLMGSDEQMRAVEEVHAATGIPFRNIWEQLDRIRENGNAATEAINQLMAAVNSNPMSGMNLAESINRQMGIGAEVKSAKESAAVFLANETGSSLAEAREQVEQMAASQKRMAGAFRDATTAAEEQKKSLSGIIFGADGLNGSFKRMFPTISGLGKRFGQLVKYRMLRAVIKEIAEGFREGTENYYRYSDAIGGEFAKNMDNATSSLAQMKNSIGAAAAPLINSLIPYLQVAVHWFIEAVNYANQFVALLRGQTTWSRATTQNVKAFEDTEKAAKGAGGAVKDLLADWDELNIIQSQSGGSGSGIGASDAKDYATMFEEVNEYNEDVKRLVDGIKENFGSIRDLVTEIGIGLLGWKLASGFSGLLGVLGGFVAAGATIDLVFKASTLFNGNYMDTGDYGWLIGDTLSTLIGGFFMKKVLNKVLGGGVGAIGIPLTLLVSAVAGIKAIVGDTDTSALSKETIVAGIHNSLKVGGAAGYLLYKFADVPFLGSVGAGLGTAVTTLGVVVGLKAIANTIDTRSITKETIKANLLSAGLVGGGLALAEFALGGSLATIVGVGAGGAVLTLGALFAIEAMIAGEPVGIQWGNKDLTESEIERFVSHEAFTVDVPTTVRVIQDQIDQSKLHREELEKDLSRMMGTFEVIRLGLAKDQDYETLQQDVDSLLGHIDQYIADAKATGRMTLTYTPTLAGDTTEDASAWYSNYVTGWDKVNAYAKEKGGEIGRILSSEERDQIIANEPQLLSTLMSQLNDVTNAMARAKINATAMSDFEFAADGAISKKSYTELGTAYNDYVNQLRTSYTNLAKEQRIAQEELVAALFTIDPNSEDYKKAKADLDKMVQNMAKSVDDEVRRASKPGADKMTELLLGIVGNLPDQMENRWTLADNGLNPFEQMFSELSLSGKNSSRDQVEAVREWAQGFISATDDELGRFVSQYDLNPFAFMTENMRKSLRESLSEYMSEDTVDNMMNGIFPDIEYDVDVSELEEPAQVAPPDMSGFVGGLNEMVSGAHDAVNGVINEFNRLNGISATVTSNVVGGGGVYVGGGGSRTWTAQMRASGGFVRSGDLVMANENGNFEMMGRMGSQPVVANNQQIVTGIASGVSQANSGVENRLNTIEGLLYQILRKEFVARAVPSSGWGAHNARSETAYDLASGR